MLASPGRRGAVDVRADSVVTGLAPGELSVLRDCNDRSELDEA
jgi:hypothetical protein